MLGGCAGTPKPWAGMLGSARDTGTMEGLCWDPQIPARSAGRSLGHCLIQRVFPLLSVVLSTWHFIRVPRAENPVGAAGIAASHTEAGPGLEMSCSTDVEWVSQRVFNLKQSTVRAPTAYPLFLGFLHGNYLPMLDKELRTNSPGAAGTGGARGVAEPRRGRSGAGAAAPGPERPLPPAASPGPSRRRSRPGPGPGSAQG